MSIGDIPTVTQAIGRFLQTKKNEFNGDLIDRWTPGMETQVNIHKADGELIEGSTNTYTNGSYTWWPIRVPKNARTEPHWHDGEMKYPLCQVGEAIGSTGWDWQARVSRWVGFDFDDITKDTGISDELLAKVKEMASSLDFVEVRKSTSGSGLHLYVHIDGIKTANHDEHAQLAKATLAKMSRDCGFNFSDSVDVCGGNMWLWHQKMNLENEGLKLLKRAERPLSKADLADWRDDLQTSHSKAGMILPDAEQNFFDELTGHGNRVSLDERHLALIEGIHRLGFTAVWHDDLHCLHTHTKGIADYGRTQDVEFATISQGTDKATPNCYCYPKHNGGLAVYRFGNAKEDASWRITEKGHVTRNFVYPSDQITGARPIPKFTFGELRAAYPNLNPPIINGLLREAETCNIISAPKIGKSWFAYGLAMSVISGNLWLGRFDTSAGEVLFIDNELQPATLSYRIPKVAEKMGISAETYEDALTLWPLRGNLRSLEQLWPEFAAIEPGRYKVIVLDAAYRFHVHGGNENDNSEMARFYNLVDRIAQHTGAAIVLIHHTAKGNQSNRRVTDVGAGAGAQSRAADCHLILREHQKDGTIVLDAAVRSFEPIDPMSLTWECPIWTPCDADPKLLKAEPTKSDRRQAARDKEAIDKVTKALKKGSASVSKLIRSTGLGRERVQKTIGTMSECELVIEAPAVNRGNSCVEYQLAV